MNLSRSPAAAKSSDIWTEPALTCSVWWRNSTNEHIVFLWETKLQQLDKHILYARDSFRGNF